MTTSTGTTATDRLHAIYRAGYHDGYHYQPTAAALVPTLDRDAEALAQYQAGYHAGAAARHAD